MATHAFASVQYRDARAGLDFLQRAFGFELIAAHEGPDGSIQHAELRWGDSILMAGEENEDRVGKWGKHAGYGWTYLSVEDADAHHDRAKQAGAEIIFPLTDTDYGSRDYTARDPEGNVWSFGTYDPLNS